MKRPIPVRGVIGWLARQPVWRLALIYWAIFEVVLLGMTEALSYYYGSGFVRPSVVAYCLGAGAFFAVGLAAKSRAINERRVEQDRAGVMTTAK